MYARSLQQDRTEAPAISPSPLSVDDPALAPGGGNAMAVAAMPVTSSAADAPPAGLAENPDWAADVDATGVGGDLLAAAMAMVDGLVPAGAGIQASGSLETTLLLLVNVAGGRVTLANAGDGFVTLKVAWDGGFGLQTGVGGGILGGELEGTLGGRVTAAGSIVLLVPWARIAGAEWLGALCSCVSVEDVAGVIGGILESADLGTYVVEVTGGAGIQGGLNAEASDGLDEAEVGVLAKYGLTYAVAWDVDETKAGGPRSGSIELTGEMGAIAEAKTELPWLVSLDLTLWKGTGAVSVHVPRTEQPDGTIAWGAPSLVAKAEMGTGGASLGVENSVGGENTTTLSVGLRTGGLFTEAVALVVQTMGGLPGDWSVESTLGMEVDWCQVRGAAAIAGTALGAWLAGAGPEPQPASLGGQTVNDLIAAADVTLGVQASCLLADAEGGAEVNEGIGLGGEGAVSAELVFSSDDVLPDIGRPPAPQIVETTQQAVA